MASLDEYQSLYRKFRPQRFEEVLGQSHVTRALRNAVVSSKVAHAYLFSGPRGTGKTSTARILAKALNCASPAQGEPCDKCESCVLIREGRSYDVEELDAASNSGVDAIRALIGTVATASYGNWKIYIIDEVHMLSQAASNALLKTLEEPPPHVVFVLATTSSNKVLQTIRSRTQHFEFHLLDNEIADQLLATIRERGELTVGPEILAWARKRGRGSARDTLSFLDQAMALGEIPGDDEADELLQLTYDVVSGKVEPALASIERLAEGGMEPPDIANDIISLCREAFLERLGVSGVDSKLVAKIARESSELPLSSLTKVMEGLGKTSLSMKDGLDPLAILEVAILTLTVEEGSVTASRATRSSLSDRSHPEDGVLQLQRRIEELEKEVNSLKGMVRTLSNAEKGGVANANWAAPKVSSRSDSIAGLKKAIGTHRVDVVSSEKDVNVVELERSRPGPTRDQSETGSEIKTVDGALVGQGPKSLPTKERLTVDWGNTIVESMTPKLRSRFQTVRFVEVEGSSIRAAFPSEMYLSRANEVKADVQRVIAAFYGLESIKMDFEIDDDQSGKRNDLNREASTDTSQMYDEFHSGTVIDITDPVVTNVLEVFPNARLRDSKSEDGG